MFVDSKCFLMCLTNVFIQWTYFLTVVRICDRAIPHPLSHSTPKGNQREPEKQKQKQTQKQRKAEESKAKQSKTQQRKAKQGRAEHSKGKQLHTHTHSHPALARSHSLAHTILNNGICTSRKNASKQF